MRYFKLFTRNHLQTTQSRLNQYLNDCNNVKCKIVPTTSSALPVSVRFFSSKSGYDPDTQRTDLEDLFVDRRVRHLLKRLTGYDYKKIFERKSLDNLNSPKYRFMTDEQLRMEQETVDHKAKQWLQMPPVKYPKEPEIEILEQDVALQGYLDPSVKVILLDATPGFSDNERLIVVREPDGTLRKATREERHRTNQIFYPVEERHIDMPKMFEEPHIDDVLNRGAYKLLLDNACLHLEPEDQLYCHICHKTYQHIAMKTQFDQLLSTRHYGGMVYYYCFYHQADSLLFHLLTSDRTNEAYNLLKLFYIVNARDEVPSWLTSFSEDEFENEHFSIAQLQKQQSESVPQVSLEQLIQVLKIYIDNDSQSAITPRLQLVFQKLQQQLHDEQNKKESVAQN